MECESELWKETHILQFSDQSSPHLKMAFITSLCDSGLEIIHMIVAQ